jgi:signal transduction histidine kinase
MNYKRLIEELPFSTFIWKINPNTIHGVELVVMSSKAEEEFGIDASHIDGSFYQCFSSYSAGERLKKVCVRVGESGISEILYDFVFKGLSRERPKNFTVFVISMDNGNIATIFHDVTDGIEAEERIKEKIEQLAERSRDLEQIVYIVSHDLREPLVSVAGFATLLKRKCADQLSEDGLHFLDEVINGTKRMERKIDDLLALSKAGQIASNRPFALRDSIDEARENMNGIVSRTNTTIEIPSALPVLSGDSSIIAQIFQNLFSNAIKYRSEDRDLVIKIGVERKPEGCWQISVSDNGIGFDQKHAEKIFGIFQRLHSEVEYSGTGIGLAIVKKIVERYGGQIWAESEPGVGSTFFFTLCSSST